MLRYLLDTYGAEISARPAEKLATIEGFTARLEVLDFDDAAAYHTGQIRAQLRPG